MLAEVRDLPQTIRYIAYQVHERFNGSGYPRGRSGPQLHEYAKLVSVADVYAAMTANRPYRKAMPPYEAAKTILYEGAEDKFDRTLVRALLDTVSLFPIGSQVYLSDGSAARVLRANPGLHTRPVVETIGSDGSPTGQVVDLAEDAALHVVRAG
jgi:HD-GYP domain-containing protein (c-di-GMP phosphodiesterase class II)